MTVLCDQCASRKRRKDHGRHDLRLKLDIGIAELCTAQACLIVALFATRNVNNTGAAVAELEAQNVKEITTKNIGS